MAHTAGPWRVGEERHAGRYQLVQADNQHRGFVCEVQAPLKGSVIDDDTRLANARLIAAAPDLYEALSEFVESFADLREEFVRKFAETKPEMARLLKARDAIAKAEGR
jgi:hypothetical protein